MYDTLLYMSEHDPTPPLRLERLENGVQALFAAHADKLTQYEEIPGIYQDRLALAILHPSRTDTTTQKPIDIPASVTTYVIEKTSAGFRLTNDIAADIAAAPTPEERRELEAQRAKRTVSTWLVLLPGDKYINHEVRGTDKWGVPYVENNRVHPDDKMLDIWLEVIKQAVPYNADTHGVLRHEPLPDGRRTGPDRIATHAEIAAHKREVALKRMHPVKRMLVKTLGRLGLE